MAFNSSERNTPAFKNALDRHITGNYGENQIDDNNDDELLSTCCSAEPANEIINGEAFCSNCHEHVIFLCGNCDDDATECGCIRGED